MINATAVSLRFASRFELQPHECRLLIDGAPASLGPHAFDVLRVLAERPDQLVTKRELMDLVWPDVVVTDNNIQQHVSALRKLLGPGVIATIPGRGYRFIARVDERPFAPAAATRSNAAVSAVMSATRLSSAPLMPDKGADEGLQTFVGWLRTILETSGFEDCPVPAHAAFERWEAVLAAALRRDGLSAGRARRLGALTVAAVEGTVAMCHAARSVQPLDDVQRELETLLTETIARSADRWRRGSAMS